MYILTGSFYTNRLWTAGDQSAIMGDTYYYWTAFKPSTGSVQREVEGGCWPETVNRESWPSSGKQAKCSFAIYSVSVNNCKHVCIRSVCAYIQACVCMHTYVSAVQTYKHMYFTGWRLMMKHQRLRWFAWKKDRH